MKKLIIAEKPSLGRNIISAIDETFKKGDGYQESEHYVVSWAYGHLFKLIDMDEYLPEEQKGWSLDNIPFCPPNFKFTLSKQDGVAAQFKVLKTLMARKDIDGIVNAGDSDREGEIIVRLIITHANCKKPVYRLWLPDQTASTIKEALSKLPSDKEYDNLANEGYARTYIDWLYGINLTRYATIRNKSLLRVGRVVTPIVTEIYNREMAIRNFKPEKYYKVKSDVDGLTLLSSKKFKTQKEADEYASLLNSKDAVVTSIDSKHALIPAGKLYSLSKLQGVLGKKYKMKPNKSLEVIQGLYEKGFVTYPRTNTEYLATAEKGKISAVIKKFEDKFPDISVSSGYKIFDDSKIESHSALTPTTSIPQKTSLSSDENNVYTTILRRFLAVFCSEKCEVDRSEMKINVKDIEEFVVKGQIMIKKGWTKYDEYTGKDKELPKLSVGQKVKTKFVSEEAQTTPPDRYTTESFYNFLKNPFKKDTDTEEDEYKAMFSGVELGTEATRTGIIDGAIKNQYIDLKDNKFYLLDGGENYIECLKKLELLLEKKKTAEMGMLLKDVFKGTKTIEDSINGTYMEICSMIKNSNTIKSAPVASKVSSGLSKGAKASETQYICPKCGRNLVQYNWGYGCEGFKDTKDQCKFALSSTVAGKKLAKDDIATLLSGKTTKEIKGFKSSAGKSFNAKLKLDENLKTTFVFADRKGKN